MFIISYIPDAITKDYFIPDEKMAKIFGSGTLMEGWETVSNLEKTPSPHLFEIFRENETPNWLELNRPVKLAKELADIVGVREASHVECVHKVWAYAKEHNLIQDHTHILPDNKLDKVLICERDLITGYAVWSRCKIIM